MGVRTTGEQGKRGKQRMQENRWTTVCNCRTTKGSYIVSGADKMDSGRRNKEVLRKLCVFMYLILSLLCGSDVPGGLGEAAFGSCAERRG